MASTVVARQVYAELHAAAVELNERGLHVAAKWAAEQLASIDVKQIPQNLPATATSQPSPPDNARYLLAKSYFNLKEYRRAAFVLKGSQAPKEVFLGCYSLYLAGERRKEEERIEKGGVTGRSAVPNREAEEIETRLQETISLGDADSFIWYLYALVMIERDRQSEAQEALLRSCHLFPWNWSAWQALQSLCSDNSCLASLALPSHWMREFFLASLHLELQQNQEALSRLHSISQLFPGSMLVASQAAQVHYNLQNYDDAESLFEDVLAQDPYRLEGMDYYSNILFVKEQFAALSHLAHKAATTDKYRPETCCIIGNYYSLKGAHEKAVEYFRRALKLNNKYLAAWTLMGHEFMEMKNTPAAIDAYRRAVDLNSHDFRAWYGLGQAYELLKMPYYALYYYRRAALLKPFDARMWCALAQCYAHDQVDMQEAAIRCYRRAIDYQDPDGIAMHMLAKLHEQRGELSDAEACFKANLERLEMEGAGAPGQALGQDAIDALLFLAAHCKDTGRLAEAEAHCQRLLDVGGPAKERAKALVREIRNLQHHGHAAAAAAKPLPLSRSNSSNLGGGGGHVLGPAGSSVNMVGGTLGFPGAAASATASTGAVAGGVAGSSYAAESVTTGLVRGGSGPTPSTSGVLHAGVGAPLSAPLPAGSHSDMELLQGDQDGLDLAVVLAVMQQMQVSRARALAALKHCEGDPSRAILLLYNATT